MTLLIDIPSFWERDLSDIHGKLLPEGCALTSLPVEMDDRVPHQGSVLLANHMSIDEEMKNADYTLQKLISVKESKSGLLNRVVNSVIRR